MAKIHKLIPKLYEDGRMTSISNEEMEKVVRRFLPDLFMSDLEKIKYRSSQAAVAVVGEVATSRRSSLMTPELQEPIMQRIIDENPSIQFAYVVDMTGKKITRNITPIADRSKYENFGVGTDYSDRDWFLKPLENGKTNVSEFYISKMTGALCITVSAPIMDAKDDEMVGIFGADIKFEEWAKRVEDVAEVTQIALKAEYEAKKKSGKK